MYKGVDNFDKVGHLIDYGVLVMLQCLPMYLDVYLEQSQELT